jgi:prepilin-type N-terminal cleavage/methylation domain-containing protein
MKEKLKGFTLIELLIVIAIILILIAIALPNFLEAQIRARVTKAKGEMRSLGIAMESYYLDFKAYPAEHERDGGNNRNLRGLFWLTSPIPYITAMPEDPFAEFGDDQELTYITYEMGGLEYGFRANPQCGACQVLYAIFSNGPDSSQWIWQENPHYDSGRDPANYAPTNGTKSRGEIFIWGGDAQWMGTATSLADNAIAKTAARPGMRMDGQVYFKRFPPN